MRVILNVLAVIFILGWLLGVFVFAAGFLIHIFLILAIFTFIINFLTEPV
ncbi:MAG: lmo0937 family membrane protein [Bacteroidetes bacterium]|nr:lmo0937 family membrane protein [Pseudopedobacter sp.]MBU0696602.1 lmo0937 family membrane protein [Bacteroidota bacterium]MBU1373034.1 lmo0937 family membrane protein [Bacteroidota bacterium]MBU1485477.1 lmo0937 family membrane protein [Bacteroidota bacterium]MBU1761704.1 lmo0937 family membrane protein [Bacteroidota bacterium]